MSVNFYTNNGYGQYQRVQKDIKDVKNNVAQVEVADETAQKALLQSVPMFRRTASLNDKLNNGDVIPAVGLVTLAAVNAPEDWRDMKAAGKQIWSKIDKNYKYDPLYIRRTHQHSFSFFRGTAIEKWLHKHIDKGNKVAKKLYDMDDFTLYDTKFGEKVQKFFGIKRINSKRVEAIKDFIGTSARAEQFKSAKFGGEITARAMKRLPLLSVVAIALLEIPKIFKAMDKGDNIGENIASTAKQTASSAVSATSTLAGIGYGGAIGAKYGGATGSLIGMGVGAVFGSITSKKLQDIIA